MSIWQTLDQLYHQQMEVTTYPDGMTLKEKLDNIDNEKKNTIECFRNGSFDKDNFDKILSDWMEIEKILKSDYRKMLQKDMAMGLYIVFGCPDAWLIRKVFIFPPHWRILEIDWDKCLAKNVELGMVYYDLLCIERDNWRKLTSEEMEGLAIKFNKSAVNLKREIERSGSANEPLKMIHLVDANSNPFQSGITNPPSHQTNSHAPSVSTDPPIKPEPTPPPTETPGERRERLLGLAREELSLRGKKGAIQRVANREGVSRQRITGILGSFPEGEEFLKQLDRA